MFLKIMSDQDLADSNLRKNYRLIECDDVNFFDFNGKVRATAIKDGKELEFEISGNAYIMSYDGKTIATKWCCGEVEKPLVGSKAEQEPARVDGSVKAID